MSSRWGPTKKKIKVEDGNIEIITNGEANSNGAAVATLTISAQHHSDEAASNDYELIDEVEWGPRRDEDGYDTDQELAPKPRRKAVEEDSCGCFPPATSGFACIDESCVLYACREECRSNCQAGPLCGNKRIQKKEFCDVEVFDAGNKGKGLRLSDKTKPATKSDLLCEYLGRAIREKALARLFRRYQQDRRLYIMSLGDGVFLDARQKGGIARYINHSCKPNCKVELWTVRGVVRAAVVAMCDIAPGEELTFDYQWERKRGRSPTVCYCGTPECRGTLEVSKSLEEQDLQREFEGCWEQMPLGQPADQTHVNRTVQIYSKEHKEYFLGEVTGYDGDKSLHCIFYRQSKTEVWEDLTNEDWMILNEKVDNEHFIIARKVSLRRDATPTTPLLTASSSDIHGHGLQNQLCRNYVYVQTPVKENLWSMHLIERCERNCSVQISTEQMARPPLPPETEEDTEKYTLLDQSFDNTVWKLMITGVDIPRAYGILRKNINFIEKKLAADEVSRSARSTPTAQPAGIKSFDSDISPTVTALNEVAFPWIVEESVKRKLQIVRNKCRNVTFAYTAPDSQITNFSKLSLEGSLSSDVESAKEDLWLMLLEACSECSAPMKANKMYCYVGFLGGILTGEQCQLLLSSNSKPSPAARTSQRDHTNEDFSSMPFVRSFENTHKCVIWIQTHDGDRISSSDKATNESFEMDSQKIFIGCKPSDVSRIFFFLTSYINELVRGTQYIHLDNDRIFTNLLTKDGGKLFDFVKHVTGATVSIELPTMDQLKIVGTQATSESQIAKNDKSLRVDDQAGLANEIVRLQVECYRDECNREQSVMFGRDWTILSSVFDDIVGSNAKVAVTSKLDRRSVTQYGLEIAEIVSKLNLDASVAGHAATILYRFAYAGNEMASQLKIREALLASIFLANKAQKVTKWKSLDMVIQCGYEFLYSGAKFDTTSEEAVNLEESVIVAEGEILRTLHYDIFWSDVEFLRIASAGAGKLKKEFIQTILDFTFSGPVLGAGAELWLKYGVKYIFAASAALLKASLEMLVSALSLDPLKVSSAAKLLVELSKYGRPTGDKTHSNPLLESVSGKKKLSQYIPSIEGKCSKLLDQSGSRDISSDATSTENRFKLIGQDNRRCYVIRGIEKTVVRNAILPVIDSIETESTCRIYFCVGSIKSVDDLYLCGSWRSIVIADYLLRSKVEGVLVPCSAIDISTHPLQRPNLPAKLHTGSMNFDDFRTDSGWLGTTQFEPTKGDSSCCKIGGKFCIPGKVLHASLRKAGLGWWNSSACGRSISGSIPEVFTIRANPESQKDRIVDLARLMVVDSVEYPHLTSMGSSSPISPYQYKAVSLQRWPPEKVESRERKSLAKSKTSSNIIGFSPAALQELQLLKQLHEVIPSSLGHPNFINPIGLSLPGCFGESNVLNISASKSIHKSDPLVEDPLLSLFHPNDVNEPITSTGNDDSERSACLVFPPTPFVLNRFISRKMRSSADCHMLSDTILASWFHDILSALVHCHENHILLRTISPDQIFVDHSGVAMIGSLYRCTVLPINDRMTTKDPLETVRASKGRKAKEVDSDVSDDPFAAPEIVLGCPAHSKASDVWSVGSLLASLLLSKPIFTGKDRESLSVSQYKIVGTPSNDNYLEGVKYPYYTKPVKKYKRGVEKALEHILKEKTPQYHKIIALISCMLHLDPKKRCTAVEALGHECMSEYVENCQSEIFRNQYAKDWIELKRRMLTNDDPEEQSRKRDAMIRSVSKRATGDDGDDDDDDLYNMDDLLDHSSSSKKSKFE